jgi:XTP/dITP diphosphohydrolase
MTATFDELVAEANSVSVAGWDFSWLDGRATEERPPWGYQRLLRARLAQASSALDIYTGGGEVLAGAGPVFPPTTAATEPWPPNIAVATRLLHPLGVVVVATGEGEPALTDGLARLAGSGRLTMPELELLPASYDLPGARLLDLVQVMDRIRVECPWSSRQTHEGLAKYGIEEAYELVEAIEDGDREELREELGDVLLQVVFHARIAEEDPDAPFSIDDVAGGIVAKLIHRHPHVFGDETATTPEEVKEHWLRTKAEEKRRTSVTEGIPLGQPGLALAAKLASRVRTAGLDVPLPKKEGVGYDLLALAVAAEAEGVDPEAALRAAARAYRDTIRETERS